MGCGVGVAAVAPLCEALGGFPALPPQPMTTAMLIAMAETRSAKLDLTCHLPPAPRAAPRAGPAELSDHSTIPANLARVAENTGDRYAVARTALARIPHGVAIIGAADGPERSCATGTAMYVSFVPPMIVIAEHPGSRTCKLIQKSGGFSVSFLHASQQDIAERAGHSAEGPDKFAARKIKPLDAPADSGGAPAVAGSMAVLWCVVRDSRKTGDHLLFTGEGEAHLVIPAKNDALPR